MEYLIKYLKINSDTIRIPELKKFIGENVEIIILEDKKKKGK